MPDIRQANRAAVHHWQAIATLLGLGAPTAASTVYASPIPPSSEAAEATQDGQQTRQTRTTVLDACSAASAPQALGPTFVDVKLAGYLEAGARPATQMACSISVGPAVIVLLQAHTYLTRSSLAITQASIDVNRCSMLMWPFGVMARLTQDAGRDQSESQSAGRSSDERG